MGLISGLIDLGHKYDPVGSWTADQIMKFDSRGIREVADNQKNISGGGWLSDRFQDLEDEAQANVANPSRGETRAATVAALLYGATDGFSGWGEAADAAGSAGGWQDAAEGATDYSAWTGSQGAAGVAGIDDPTLASMFNGAVKGSANNALYADTTGGDWRRAARRGAIAGGLSPGMPNAGEAAGIDNPYLQNSFNGAVYGGGSAALQGGDWKQGAIQGAAPGLLHYGANMFDTPQDTNILPQSRAPWANQDNTGIVDRQYSQAPWGSNTGSYNPSYVQPPIDSGRSMRQSAGGNGEDGGFGSTELGKFVQGLLPTDSKGYGDLAQGLLGFYNAYQQRKNAKQLMNTYGGLRQSYENQMRKNLMAKDAASGRRSDYGGREVALQAALAQQGAAMMPSLMQAQGQANAGLADMFRSGLWTGGKLGWFGNGYNPNVPNGPAVSGPGISMGGVSQQPSQPDSPYSLDYRKRLGGGY